MLWGFNHLSRHAGLSLGDFERGGQLVVDPGAGGDGRAPLVVVDTRSRVAKVDGRFPHWARVRGGGARRRWVAASWGPERVPLTRWPARASRRCAGTAASASPW